MGGMDRRRILALTAASPLLAHALSQQAAAQSQPATAAAVSGVLDRLVARVRARGR